MSVYLSIFLVLALLALPRFTPRQESLVFVFLYMFLVLFVGTRFDTGCDFESYYHRFTQLTRIDDSLTNITEPGYFLLNYSIKAAGLDYIWVNLLGAAIFFYYLIKFARNHDNPLLVIALTFPVLVVQLSMSGLRQALAVAFLMGALDAFMRARRGQVAIYIVLASTFHQSAIILLPLALMVGRNFSLSRVVGAIILLMPVAVFLLSDRMSVYQDRYITQIYGETSSAGAIFRLGILIITASLFELYRPRMALLYPRAFNAMRLFSLVSFALIPVMLISTVAVHRLIYFVVPMQAYLLAALPAAIFRNPRDVRAAALFPIALYIAYILVWFSLSRHAQICYIPYQSYLL